MDVTIEPGFLKGELQVPASKSMMQRACAAALLHKGKTIINNPGGSDDDKAALDIISQLGASVEFSSGNRIEINSDGIFANNGIINCAESGLSARMFIPIIALSDKQVTITGSGTLMNRPMHVLDELLPQLGVKTQSSNGHLPFKIEGPLKARDVLLDGSTSSQFLTGLLFAFSYQATELVTIQVENLKSRPYIDMTLEVLEVFGKTITHENYERFLVDPSRFDKKTNMEITVESDWSSAAFWLVAGAITGEVSLGGLNIHSKQADKAVLHILETAGVSLQVGDNIIKVNQTRDLKNFFYDATDSPDLFPVLSVLAAYCGGESRIKGIHRLMHKESNRLESITGMLDNFGIIYSTEDDELIVAGGNPLQGCEINSYNDHRIAMASAVAALGAQGPITIHAAGAVSKSYPDFFSDLSLLGGRLTTNNND
jgi:3-phosphoshikimate 1-carboxyvinyltransferase